jgi:uncharacterized protein YecE (DUF72 family)
MTSRLHVGTAGWSIPRDHAAGFPPAEIGSVLSRYARILSAVEINSTFYRRHRESTFARWRESVPPGFRFALKLSKSLTHESELASPRALIEEFFADAAPLAESLGAVLVQLPGSLAFESRRAAAFFRALRARYGGPVAFEPRHASWYEPKATALLVAARISRVVADPPRPAAAREPDGDPGLLYLRLHGSPRMYYSAYGPERLAAIAQTLRQSEAAERWCIFDNTASGSAAGDALHLAGALGLSRPCTPG